MVVQVDTHPRKQQHECAEPSNTEDDSQLQRSYRDLIDKLEGLC